MSKDLPIRVHGSGDGGDIRVVNQNPRQLNLPDSPFHFPDYHVTWGEPERTNVRVSLSQKAYTQVMEHAASDRREVGGLLLGLAYRSTADKSYHNRIVLALPHHHGIGQMATFAFTHEGWATLVDEVEREYPQLRIVGWYHSHPNYGAFFSGTDKETQRNYFSTPWRVGLVVDHIRHEGAFFVLAPGSNKVEPLPGFYEYVGRNGKSVVQWQHYKMRPAPTRPTSPPPPDPALPPLPPPPPRPYQPAADAKTHIAVAAPVAASSSSSTRLPMITALLAAIILILLILANLQLAGMGGNINQLVSNSTPIANPPGGVATLMAISATLTYIPVLQTEVAMSETRVAKTETAVAGTQTELARIEIAVAATQTKLAPPSATPAPPLVTPLPTTPITATSLSPTATSDQTPTEGGASSTAEAGTPTAQGNTPSGTPNTNTPPSSTPIPAQYGKL